MPLRALLIAINQYDPSSLVPPLQGCVNDIGAVRQFLEAFFSEQLTEPDAILTLMNEQATRAGVTAAFRKHFQHVGSQDTVLIYYSGHGSRNPTATEFQDMEPDGMEEGWVLYDSRLPGNYDLADKEIALLLEEISKGNPNIIVIADSCHSGSVTRDIEDFSGWKPRFIPGIANPRPLASYLNGTYLRRVPGPGVPRIPATRHLLLSAARHNEKAWESAEKCGIFTRALVNNLHRTGGQISYSELHARISADLRAITRQQHPQTEPFGGFNPQTGFLGRPVPPKNQRRYQVWLNRNSGQWCIRLGADTGLRTDMQERIPVELFDAPTDGNSLGTAYISFLNVSESVLDIGDLALKKLDTYWATPLTLPLIPFPVYCPDLQAVQALTDELSRRQDATIPLSNFPTGCPVELRVENGNFVFYATERKALIHGIKGSQSIAIARTLDVLDQLAHWHRIHDMEHPGTRILQHEVSLDLSVSMEGAWLPLAGESVVLPIRDESIPFRVTVSNRGTRPLHMALVYLDPRYGMEVIPHPKTAPVAAGAEAMLLLENDFFLPENVDEELDTLKLIVSTEKIDEGAFSREALQPVIVDPNTDKGILRSIGNGLTRPDWCTRTIRIRLLRDKTDGQAGEFPLLLANGQITIGAHSAFRSSFSLTSPAAHRGLDAIRMDAAWQQQFPQARWLSLANTRGEEAPFLDFTDIQNAGALAEQPLDMRLAPADTQSIILPFWFDGENFLPLGETAIQSDGSLLVRVRHIPEDTTALPTRSVGKALRLLFFQFAREIGFTVETQTLRWVEYLPDNQFKRHTDHLADKVRTARKITLLLHGIIGDTQTLAPAFRNDDPSDLVLCFDYENLKTPIEDSALALSQLLSTPEMATALQGRKITLVAHSMGGLVARYFIEHLNGHTLVERLVMAGTPNGGSKLGNIPDYLNWACTALGLGMRYFSWNLPAIAGFVGALQAAKEQALVTLDQMKPGSDFLRRLAAGGPPPIPYRAIAGDIDRFLSIERDPGFWDNVLVQTGRWVYRNEKNDGAVAVDSVFAVDAAEKEVVAEHHWGYFEGDRML